MYFKSGRTHADLRRIGGNNAYYTVERGSTIDPAQRYVDLLAVGTGISGGLGNGLWSSASSNPVKVKRYVYPEIIASPSGAFL